MRFVVNFFRPDLRVVAKNGPPLPDAVLEDHAFGVPPREVRQAWIVEVADLNELAKLAREDGLYVWVQKTGYWSGTTPDNPGERLFGLGISDGKAHEIHPADRPVQIGRQSGMQ